MADSNDPVCTRIIWMLITAERAPVAVWPSDKEHGPTSVEDIYAHVALRLIRRTLLWRWVGHSYEPLVGVLDRALPTIRFPGFMAQLSHA